MSKIKVHWFLPTGRDSRDVLPDPDRPGQRSPDHDWRGRGVLLQLITIAPT